MKNSTAQTNFDFINQTEKTIKPAGSKTYSSTDKQAHAKKGKVTASINPNKKYRIKRDVLVAALFDVVNGVPLYICNSDTHSQIIHTMSDLQRGEALGRNMDKPKAARQYVHESFTTIHGEHLYIFIDTTGAAKVGRSGDVPHRAFQIQFANSSALMIGKVWEGMGYMEKYVHSVFKAYRGQVHSKWYKNISVEKIDAIISGLQTGGVTSTTTRYQANKVIKTLVANRVGL